MAHVIAIGFSGRRPPVEIHEREKFAEGRGTRTALPAVANLDAAMLEE
jgi:hypothetical protein